ncbi:cysteine proteinase [Lentinula lateritia]|nr:cysteine proteinase [Lentinula lateritia]
MAKSKWIFGNQQNQPATVVVNPAPLPIESSADTRQFGLENFGNTCYANSVLQALYFCAPFRDLLLQSPDSLPPARGSPLENHNPSPLVPVRRKPERKASTSGTISDGASAQAAIPIPPNPASLFSALRSLFLHISTHPSDKGTVAPSAFIEQLRRVNELFRSTMHQDAHEFFNYLLNKIVEEIEEDRKVSQHGSGSADDLSNSITTLGSKVPSTMNSANSDPLPDSTLVHKLFEGTLTSETRCLTCETVSSRDESFIDLSIDIEQNSSVTACLRQFSASEMLCQRNKFFCDACCDLQEAEKRMKIKKLPNVLALHLKRFKYQEDSKKYIKLSYRVAFPLQLRLFNTVDDAEDADKLYNLFAIVVHLGNGPHHGHYISIIKTLGAWYVFDDDNVYPIAEKDIPKYYGDSNAGSAYVLYYEAADIDRTSLGLRAPPLPTQTLASIPPSPSLTNPTLPPGLADEGDSSDLSDPPYPVTPAQNSPLLAPISNLSRPALELKVAGPNGVPPQSPASPTLVSSPANGRGSKGFFPSIRRVPSAKPSSSPDTIRTVVDSTPLTQDDSSTVPNRTPSPTTSTSSSNTSSSWLNQHSTRDARIRRPSEPSPASSYTLPPSRPSRPKSSAEGLTVKPSNWDSDRHDPSPGSASSSNGPSSPATHLPSSIPATPSHILNYGLPPRKSSLVPEIPLKSPDRKKSLTSLPRIRDKARNHHIDNPPRPSTAPGNPLSMSGSSSPVPPIPPIPSPTTMPDGYNLPTLEKGKMRGSSDNPLPPPSSGSPLVPAPGLHTFAGVNHSSSSTGMGGGNAAFKRASRKLSISGQIIFGFGKKDKDKKEREREEREGGKGPPSSYHHH